MEELIEMIDVEEADRLMQEEEDIDEQQPQQQF